MMAYEFPREFDKARFSPQTLPMDYTFFDQEVFLNLPVALVSTGFVPERQNFTTTCPHCSKLFHSSEHMRDHICFQAHSFDGHETQAHGAPRYRRSFSDGDRKQNIPKRQDFGRNRPANNNRHPSARSPLPPGATVQSGTFIIHYGASVQTDSLVGGCGWWIKDDCERMLSNGSLPVVQTFPSQIRLEFEAVLNGLKEAFLKHIRSVVVRGSSQIVSERLQGKPWPVYALTMYSEVKDLDHAIMKLIPEFEFRVEQITPQQNFYAHKLAKNVILEYHRKRDMRIAKQQVMEQRQTSSINKVVGPHSSLRSPSTDFPY